MSMRFASIFLVLLLTVHSSLAATIQNKKTAKAVTGNRQAAGAALPGSPSDRKTLIREYSHTVRDTSVRVVMNVEGPLKYSVNRLKDPERLYIDLTGARLSSGRAFRDRVVGVNGVSRVRVAQFSEDSVRVVFDLRKRVGCRVSTAPGRFVIDLTDGGTDDEELFDLQPVKVNVPPPKKFFTVVVDAGHGGKDTGAIGHSGLVEKDVTLDVAKRLKAALEKNPDLKVILTRDADEYLSLHRRTDIANEADADLFVSVHANSAESATLRGIETWFMNATTNKEWQEVADRENAIDGQSRDHASDLDRILQDLNRSYKIEESMGLAHSVQGGMIRSLKPEYADSSDLGVKWAKFQVLVGAKMPAVLVEIGFMSHLLEEQRIRSDAYRSALVTGLAEGITGYVGRVKTAAVAQAQEAAATPN